MATSNFELQPAIENWLAAMQHKGGITPDDLNELKSHLLESTDDLHAKGLSIEEAFIISMHRLGNESQLADEFKKVNGNTLIRSEWVLMILGVLLFLLIRSCWFALNSLTFSLGAYGYISSETSILLEFLKSGILLLIIYKIMNSQSIIKFLMKYFYKNPVNFSFLFVSIASISIYAFYLLKSWLSFWLSRGHPAVFDYGDGLLVYSFWVVPIGFYILLFYKLIREASSNRRFKIGFVINTANFLFFFLFGIGWEFLAAITRLVGYGRSMWLEVSVFGFVFFIGSYLIVRYVVKKTLIKLFVFCSFAAVVELTGGFLNPLLTMGTPLSVFAYSLIAGIGAGYFLGRLFRRRSGKKNNNFVIS